MIWLFWLNHWFFIKCQLVGFQWMVDLVVSEINDSISLNGWFSCIINWWFGFREWSIQLYQKLMIGFHRLINLVVSKIYNWVQLCQRSMILLQWWVTVWLLILSLSVDNGSSLKNWWNMACNLWCVVAGGSNVKIYETWSMDITEGWRLQWGSRSFLTVVTGNHIRGLKLPSSRSWEWTKVIAFLSGCLRTDMSLHQ